MTEHPEQMPEDYNTAVFLAQVALLGVGPGAYEPRHPGYVVVDSDSKISIRLDD
ncbi:hypothetical protein [Streptomyces sp. NPDC094032]|uniref:hypothetical protein n=1 Tax=Streptomyces sp. NPDC094032 TaxID=3155308 RepID=UPI00331CA818